ncbi:MAG TPA: NAD-dependent epimerase/dehydratase family protein [Terriglobales bacterium]|jgi:nucleoside-diphosphate-sugar epimerase
MRIFVTGATGVIGIRAVPQLVKLGHQVTGVGRSPEKRVQLENLGAVPVVVDIFDPVQAGAAVAGHDAVLNLATHIPPGPKIFLRQAWRENDRIRGIASGVLARAALERGVGTFIQESFAPIYADGGDGWIEESLPVKPVRYNRTLLQAEQAAQSFTNSGGTGIVLRFAGFYGPDAEQVPAMLQMVGKGWSPLPGPRGAFISFVAHDDAASAVVAALRARAGTYNVVDDNPPRRGEFFGWLAELLHAPAPRFLPPWAARLLGSLGEMLTRSERISNRKFCDETGWHPMFRSAREGWQAMLAELPKAA